MKAQKRMSTYDFPIKSVVIVGNLNSSLKYKLCPLTEFSEGKWNMCLYSAAYSCNINDVNSICSISCNLVKAQKYNLNNEIELYEQPLGICQIQSVVSKRTFNYEKTWFYINSLSNELEISIKNESNQQKLSINCEMYIQLLFRRVK